MVRSSQWCWELRVWVALTLFLPSPGWSFFPLYHYLPITNTHFTKSLSLDLIFYLTNHAAGGQIIIDHSPTFFSSFFLVKFIVLGCLIPILHITSPQDQRWCLGMFEDGHSILVLLGHVPTLSLPLLSMSLQPLLLLPSTLPLHSFCSLFGFCPLRGFGGSLCKGGGVLEMGNR